MSASGEERLEQYLDGRYELLATALGLISGGDLVAAEAAVRRAVARSWPLIEAGRSDGDVDERVMALGCREGARGRRHVTVIPARGDDTWSSQATLEALPRHDRVAVVLHDYLGWSSDRTARAAGMDEARMALLLGRARQALAPVRAALESAAGFVGATTKAGARCWHWPLNDCDRWHRRRRRPR